MTHRPAAPGSAVRTWIDHSSSRQPLCERAVLELSRRVQRWQQHPAGPSHAPKPVRRSALRARDQLVNHNLRLVTHTWQRQCHSASLPAREEGTVDALQEAALNLVRAAEKFDPAKGYRFSTYATFWVQRGLNDYQQRYMRSIRFPADRAAVMMKAERLIRQHKVRTGEQPTRAWVAAQLQLDGKPISLEKLNGLFDQWQLTRADSLDAGEQSNEERTELSLVDQASLHREAQQQLDDQAKCEHRVLGELMQQLDETEQRLIRNRYLRRPPLSPCQMRRSMGGLKQEQIEEMEERALTKLRHAAEERKHEFTR
jgi:RNA polymerase primary sigma factor